MKTHRIEGTDKTLTITADMDTYDVAEEVRKANVAPEGYRVAVIEVGPHYYDLEAFDSADWDAPIIEIRLAEHVDL